MKLTHQQFNVTITSHTHFF